MSNVENDVRLTIALDFDDTYNRYPKMWNKVIKKLREFGSKVYIVSDRAPDDGGPIEALIDNRVDGFYFTDGEPKLRYMAEEANINIDIWIDDDPGAILGEKESDENDKN